MRCGVVWEMQIATLASRGREKRKARFILKISVAQTGSSESPSTTMHASSEKSSAGDLHHSSVIHLISVSQKGGAGAGRQEWVIGAWHLFPAKQLAEKGQELNKWIPNAEISCRGV